MHRSRVALPADQPKHRHPGKPPHAATPTSAQVTPQIRSSSPLNTRNAGPTEALAALAETEAEAGRDPDRLRDQPHALVHVVGIAEGSLGMCGRPMGSLDLIQHMTAPHRGAIANIPTAGLPPGTVLDPVCGMTVDLNTTDLTLEMEDTVYGFCHGQCRRIFADEHGVPLNA